MQQSLIQKYNVPGPRYTSYPTVPYWESNKFSKAKWIESLQRSFKESNSKDGISLYLHLPFCENLCTFCACHKHITKRHNEFEAPYIKALLKELDLYLDLLEEVPIVKEIHLGGGTPTFFSPNNLKFLINSILEKVIKHSNYEFSFEGHPNNTSWEHLKTLFDLGFTRVSFGVQDYNLMVQRAINRIQPFENVEKVTNWAREIGYESISHDLIFGLPFQTEESIVNTINKTKVLLPDRISFYSYAHVPWIKGVGQRGFNEDDLPKGETKRKLYELGKKQLATCGYIEIGMDHFALPFDSLYKAIEKGTLHRNFMGYTHNRTKVMIGLGMSAISDSWYAFAQNAKTVKQYLSSINTGEIPISKGHILTNEDLIIRKHILNIMCGLSTSWEKAQTKFPNLYQTLKHIEEMEADELLYVNNSALYVNENARPFLRNICMAFDLRMQKKVPHTKLFSMTI